MQKKPKNISNLPQKTAVKKVKKHTAIKAKSGLHIDVVGTDGKKIRTMELPKELFGVKVHTALIAQAVRVYLLNQRQGSAHTKTRGEVEGSTRKIYKQKGTGKARHGSIRAPIFVGGGIVFGPMTRDFSKKMPKRMKRIAFLSALTQKYLDAKVIIVDGLGSLEAKTKRISQVMHALGVQGRTLLVVSDDIAGIAQAVRNLQNVDMVRISDVHTYALMSHQTVVLTAQGIIQLQNVLKQE